MRPSVVVEGARVFLGDCRDVLKTLPDNSVDSVVTDPPYELGFMGKKWDNSGIAYDVTVWEECLRVLKPGGHILAFGGTRTWHRLAVAIEDAGFQLRDSIAWLYSSGFPKSLDVSKAVDKRAGVARERIPFDGGIASGTGNFGGGNSVRVNDGDKQSENPVTPEAKTWQGWGTALKPAFEPVVVGRKPIEGTVANNVLRWGVGGLNIDGSRIGMTPGDKAVVDVRSGGSGGGRDGFLGDIDRAPGQRFTSAAAGRWPANVVLDEFTAGLLDEQSGIQKDGVAVNRNSTPGAIKPMNIFGDYKTISQDSGYGGQGGASRFFYQAKASKRDRNEGLEDLEERNLSDRGSDGQRDKNSIVSRQTVTKNFHPTVKPTALMRYLIKLVTPEGGTVLDPFTGSGSTGKAALLDGYGFVGAELTEEYLPIIEGRLRWAVENRNEDGTLF